MKNMEVKIIFEVTDPGDIKYNISPRPIFENNTSCIFHIMPNTPLDIYFSIVERKGYNSNITIKKIFYEDHELPDLDNFCTLFKDNRSYKTHGYIDGGKYRIRIRSNPISQQFIEYLLGMTVLDKKVPDNQT